MCIAQQNALNTPSVSPYLTDIFLSSLKSSPPITHNTAAGQIDQCIFLEEVIDAFFTSIYLSIDMNM